MRTETQNNTMTDDQINMSMAQDPAAYHEPEPIMETRKAEELECVDCNDENVWRPATCIEHVDGGTAHPYRVYWSGRYDDDCWYCDKYGISCPHASPHGSVIICRRQPKPEPKPRRSFDRESWAALGGNVLVTWLNDGKPSGVWHRATGICDDGIFTCFSFSNWAALTNEDARYSTDNGVTWHPCTRE